MPIRTAKAKWTGNLKEGKGAISTESEVISSAQYAFSTRFENQKGVNPEELMGASLASCYSMALSNALASAGHKPKLVYTFAKVHIEKVPDGFAISRIDLEVEGEVPGVSDDEFDKLAAQTGKACPVAKALAGTRINVNANLRQEA